MSRGPGASRRREVAAEFLRELVPLRGERVHRSDGRSAHVVALRRVEPAVLDGSEALARTGGRELGGGEAEAVHDRRAVDLLHRGVLGDGQAYHGGGGTREAERGRVLGRYQDQVAAPFCLGALLLLVVRAWPVHVKRLDPQRARLLPVVLLVVFRIRDGREGEDEARPVHRGVLAIAAYENHANLGRTRVQREVSREIGHERATHRVEIRRRRRVVPEGTRRHRMIGGRGSRPSRTKPGPPRLDQGGGRCAAHLLNDGVGNCRR